MTENPLITEIDEGTEFTGFYVLKRCALKESSGNFRINIELSDRSGSVPGVIWDNAQEIREQLDQGMVVKVQGMMLSYHNAPQVRVEKIREARGGECDPESFLPQTPANMDALAARLDELVASITDPFLSELACLIFENAQFREGYFRSPGGMRWHHPYLGGLLEHSIGVADICDFVAGRHPNINRDLLVVAALLHDAGKLKEYKAATTIEFTDEGRLEGHIVIGERLVRNMCERIDGFPPKLKMLLSHLMLAHQGHKEFSSPVEPMIPEAFILYYADEMDSKLNALDRIAEKPENQGENWSDFVRILSRYIYLDRTIDEDD